VNAASPVDAAFALYAAGALAQEKIAYRRILAQQTEAQHYLGVLARVAAR